MTLAVPADLAGQVVVDVGVSVGACCVVDRDPVRMKGAAAPEVAVEASAKCDMPVAIQGEVDAGAGGVERAYRSRRRAHTGVRIHVAPRPRFC